LYRAPAAARVTFPPLVPGWLVARPNRFLVEVRVGDEQLRAACRDPGRLEGLLKPGVEVRLRVAPGARRATGHDLVLTRHRGRWVCLIPALANEILAAALSAGGVPGLEGVSVLGREVSQGRSRFDFLLDFEGRRTLAEVKSVAWRRGQLGCFPDAPTRRGTRHLEELIERRRQGGAALLVFVVQRGDVEAVAAADDIDPAFARTLWSAAAAGVSLRAFACSVTTRGCRIARRLPLLIGPGLSRP
jgi:sugar fermentation stimulation protein A